MRLMLCGEPPLSLPDILERAIVNATVFIARYEPQLRQFGLTSVQAVKRYQPEKLIKTQNGHRDVMLLDCPGDDGAPMHLYLKRNWTTPRKNGLRTLLRRGRVWSISRQEWENCQALNAAGIRTAELVAWGEECGPLWERFSFIITRAASGAMTLEQFLRDCRDPICRRRTLHALAQEIRRMHDAGLFSPDLFARHVFVDDSVAGPRFCLIDMARVDRRRPSLRLRARDLAALNITAPLRFVTARERVRFLRAYGEWKPRRLVGAIRRRVAHLLGRAKFSDFSR